MKIEHIALYLNDLEGAKKFFEKYFGAKAGKKYHNKTTDFKSYFLSFEDSTRLEIMTRPGLLNIGSRQQHHMGFIHLAFSVGSRERVDYLTGQLFSDGFKIISGPRTTGDGYYESCVQGFEDNMIEITV